MNKQLELTSFELSEIGFVAHVSPADELNEASIYYSIPFLNGEFIYNTNPIVGYEQCRWYMRNNNGEGYNFNWMDINKVAELYVILSCFKVKYTPIIF